MYAFMISEVWSDLQFKLVKVFLMHNAGLSQQIDTPDSIEQLVQLLQYSVSMVDVF